MLNGARNDKDGDAVIDVDASDASSEDDEEPAEIEDYLNQGCNSKIAKVTSVVSRVCARSGSQFPASLAIPHRPFSSLRQGILQYPTG